MKATFCRLVLALLCTVEYAHAPAAADDDLGRLFHTPQRRAQLDEMRRRNIPIVPQQQNVDSIALQGIVRRSSGHATVWINGQAHQDLAPVQALGQNAARIRLGEGSSEELRVGEKIKITRQSGPEETR